MMAYAYSKTQAERDLWTFADEHPHVDITTSKFSLRDVPVMISLTDNFPS